MEHSNIYESLCERRNEKKINRFFAVVCLFTFVYLGFEMLPTKTISCFVDQSPVQCQAKVDKSYPNKYEVVYYPSSGLYRAERI